MSKAIIALIIASFILAGCGHEGEHSHTTVDVASPNNNIHFEKESATLFTENLELFMEFDPIVVGSNSDFLLHFTLLNGSYSPLDNAQVLLRLEIEGEKSMEFQCAKSRAGIYNAEVSLPDSGEAKIRIIVKTETLADQFVLDHVHVFKDESEIHSHGHEEVSGQVKFLKEQAWSTEFDVEQLVLRDFSPVINTSGEILAMPGEKLTLIAKNDGIVLFSTRNMVQGSPVKKGNLVFTISGKGFAEDNISVKFQSSRLQFEKSKNQYLRHKNLVEEKIVSKSQFNESLNQYLSDSVAYYNLKNTVSDGGLKVYAPLTGYIHELNVSEGQFVSTGSVLATVSSNKVLLLRADVPQQHYKILGGISDATFRPAYSEKVYTIDELNGKLLAKASSVAENNHYMPVYFEVINDGTLLEGAFAEFHLKTKARPGKLVVPFSALVEEQNNFYVYVQLSGETYEKRQIQPGDADGIYVEVVSGLDDGDRVVTKGSVLLKAASVSTAPVHSHAH
ncbi:MAG: efflux RND transporter periplasmic adaptor subunit [Bacteroidales bacterium]|jgi:RND family efflux transporter MFP subunit|nr:efflux RND transporter periplasmic adaptor subunit [Bacteroidales bacterium]